MEVETGQNSLRWSKGFKSYESHGIALPCLAKTQLDNGNKKTYPNKPTNRAGEKNIQQSMNMNKQHRDCIKE